MLALMWLGFSRLDCHCFYNLFSKIEKKLGPGLWPNDSPGPWVTFKGSSSPKPNLKPKSSSVTSLKTQQSIVLSESKHWGVKLWISMSLCLSCPSHPPQPGKHLITGILSLHLLESKHSDWNFNSQPGGSRMNTGSRLHVTGKTKAWRSIVEGWC